MNCPTPAPLRLPRYNTLTISGQEIPPAGWRNPGKPLHVCKEGAEYHNKWCKQPHSPSAVPLTLPAAPESCGDLLRYDGVAENCFSFQQEMTPTAGNSQCQAEWGSEQAGGVEGVPAHPMASKDPTQTQMFYDSMAHTAERRFQA